MKENQRDITMEKCYYYWTMLIMFSVKTTFIRNLERYDLFADSRQRQPDLWLDRPAMDPGAFGEDDGPVVRYGCRLAGIGIPHWYVNDHDSNNGTPFEC